MHAPSPEVERLARSLRAHGAEGARLAFVLGSGFGIFAERLQHARTIDGGEIDGLPRSAVPGHAGKLVIGDVRGVRVIVQQGRVHMYEGWSVHEVTRAVRAFAAIGCKGIVLTNAAGGLRREWMPGTLMRIVDHINLQGRTPLEKRESGSGSPYDEDFGRALESGAEEAHVDLQRGVYAGLPGPAYETPAEIRMLAWMGADAVGMSTVAEALAARACSARVAAISCITNQAAGITGERLSHAEVVAAGHEASQRFCNVLEMSVPHLAAVRK